ncbi:hypothetical protein OAH87_03120 [Marinomonas sp.]|nr:hypothetical protein [Marinomonas sp.]MDB4837439.1 hypothetical protein [Marinomonas sp.]
MGLKKLNHKNQKRFSQLLKEATHKLNIGQYQQALVDYEKIYQLTHDPRSLQLKGLCFYKINLLDESVRASELALLKFKQLGQRDIPSLENLTEVYGIKGDDEKSRYYGQQCLQAKDSLVVTKKVNAQAYDVKPLVGTKRIFSFSLYGASPRYCENALLNVQAASEIFPDFICRFYVDDSVPLHVRERLLQEKAEVVQVSNAFASLPGTMWRFLALDDAEVELVICRDADSVISIRERAIVQEWLQSDFSAHIIRDFPSHCELLLAGLFALKNGVVHSVGDAMLSFLEGNKVGRYTDQQFLRSFIWPQIKGVALTHDRCFQYGQNLGLEQLDLPESSTDHIGANLGSKSIQLQSNLKDGTKIRFYFVLEKAQRFGPYPALVNNKSWSSPIPEAYISLLNDKRITIEWEAV